MLEEYDTWSQVFNQIFEVRATNVRVADTLIKQLPRRKAQVSSDCSTAAGFRTVTDRLMRNQVNEHSEAILPRKFQSSSSSAVESVQHERLCSLESVASEYSTFVARKGMLFFSNGPSRAILQSLNTPRE